MEPGKEFVVMMEGRLQGHRDEKEAEDEKSNIQGLT